MRPDPIQNGLATENGTWAIDNVELGINNKNLENDITPVPLNHVGSKGVGPLAFRSPEDKNVDDMELGKIPISVRKVVSGAIDFEGMEEGINSHILRKPSGASDRSSSGHTSTGNIRSLSPSPTNPSLPTRPLSSQRASARPRSDSYSLHDYSIPGGNSATAFLQPDTRISDNRSYGIASMASSPPRNSQGSPKPSNTDDIDDVDQLREEMRLREIKHASKLQAEVEKVHREMLELSEREVSESVKQIEEEEQQKEQVELEAMRVEMEASFAAQQEVLIEQEIANILDVKKKEAEEERVKILQRQQEDLERDQQEAMDRQATIQAEEHNNAIEAERDRLKMETDAIIQTEHVKIASLEEELQNIYDQLRLRLEKEIEALELRLREENEPKKRAMIAELQSSIDRAETEKQTYHQMYIKENKARKIIYSKYLELQGNVRVFCRVRPILEAEKSIDHNTDVTEFPSDEDIVIKPDATSKFPFEFDKVFQPNSTDDDVFETVKPMCQNVLDGFNATVFAYGQAGSGKSFTINGINPKLAQELFELIVNLKQEWRYEVKFSMLEIINEEIFDLLDSKQEKAPLQVNQSVDGISVLGLLDIEVTSAETLLHLLEEGQTRRSTEEHDLNSHSSKSHTVMTVTVVGRSLQDSASPPTTGKLHLLDLAGVQKDLSESEEESRLSPDARAANTSLSALGDVVGTLARKGYPQFSNTTLTTVLQESLSTRAKIYAFINISPIALHIHETLISLSFGTKCRNVGFDDQARASSTRGLSSAGSFTLKSIALMKATNAFRGNVGSVTPSKKAQLLNLSAAIMANTQKLSTARSQDLIQTRAQRSPDEESSTSTSSTPQSLL